MSDPRVLVVDDEMHTREICVDFLDGTGYSVDSCANGKEALALLSQNSYNILISDIQMPEMDGIALLKEAKPLYPEMEIILMTAFGGLASAVDAVRFGAYDYLTKPLTRDFFLNTLRRCQEKIELKRKLKESQEKLVEQERLAAIGTVAAWLSHKMRNSLSVILMCAHYLNEKITDTGTADFKDVIEAIIDKIRSLEKTTSDLIDYSKTYELQKVPGSINKILETTVGSLSVQLQIQGVKMEKQLDPALPDIPCDPHVLQEALENLIINALQAIGEQKDQTLLVRSVLVRNNGQSKISVLIENSGSRIEPGNEEKIFVPFFTTKESGSGLGLAIVKKVIEQHGGRIRAQSSDRDGRPFTAFEIDLPAEGGK